ncbi:MAG: peptidoglycan-binding protein [Coriobacteriaceae bacterium]|nr:peptidoglycan-binding protein [Coriobacteriaceae bacterium]
MEVIVKGSSGAAVADVQRRLQSLGFELGQDIASGTYGLETAEAVMAFRAREGISVGDYVDQETWAALVDATFTLGDRVLYLRMPYFHGRDVATLQSALESLGFNCGGSDGIFGAHTERALREFQFNAGITSDGIAGTSTFNAIERLHHAWQGKGALTLKDQTLGFSRAAAVLESASICVFSTEAVGKAIAERVSNLALATTSASRVVSAQSLTQVPAQSTLMVQLATVQIEPEDGIPLVLYDDDTTLNTRIRTAIESIASTENKIIVQIEVPAITAPDFSARDEQHCAVALLDALCLAVA